MQLLIILLSLVTLINSEIPAGYISKRPHHWHKSKLPLRTIMIQIRNGGRLPPGLLLKGPMSQRLRPMKIAPNYMFKTQHIFGNHKRPQHQQYLPPKQFQSSQPGPNTGQYIYENPFKNQISQSHQKTQSQQNIQPIHNAQSQSQSQPQSNFHSQIDNTIHITHDNSGPIHTIPAPNLSNNIKFQTNDFSDNHLSLTDSQKIFTSSLRPLHIHQYQVTEDPTNDLTIHDPYSGQQKFFAPDPDPSLQSKKILHTTDYFSTPSNKLPVDVAASSTLAKQFYQFVDSVPQQQLQDYYALPLTTQPQLQQHMLQQQASFIPPGMPMSVYNPTYLVTQSNNLFNQHQLQQQSQPQQFFKPELNYGTPFSSGQLFDTHNLQDGIESVASPGQIYAAAQDQLEQLQDEYNLQASSSQNVPSVAQLIGSNPHNKINNEPLTTDEFANLLKLNKPQQETTVQIIDEINHFPTSPSDNTFTSNFFDFSPRQNENEKIISQANHDLIQENQFLEQEQLEYNHNINQQQQELSAHEQHQKYLAQQFDHIEPMRIFVPDDEYQDKNIFQKRSDNESNEDTVEDNRQYSTEINSKETLQS